MTQTTKIDIFDPDQVSASDLPDWNKLYLLGFIVSSPNREHRRPAVAYICEMIGNEAGMAFVGLLSYYGEKCQGLLYPTLTEFEEALKRVLESL